MTKITCFLKRAVIEETLINNLENYVQEIVAPIKANISESASEYVKESEYNKKKNIEKLKSYGIDSEKPQPKKEKKLTLNAAFKQVFGELLEPMGFKLVKSKHPYFVCVVNGEYYKLLPLFQDLIRDLRYLAELLLFTGNLFL